MLIIMQIVALSPSYLEDPAPAPLSIDKILHKDDTALATEVPKNEVPDYTIHKFDYVSSRNGEREWKLMAAEAFLYNHEKLVHSKDIKAFLFDAEGKATVITGLEAKYKMTERDLEIFGKVKAVFPDGFELESDYMRYQPQKHRIAIPINYFTQGNSQPKSTSQPSPAAIASSQSQDQKDSQTSFHFKSFGLIFEFEKSAITLLKDVEFSVDRPDTTTIFADHCVVLRKKQKAHFTMNPSRELNTRFVRILENTLYAQGRETDLNYGNFDNFLQYLNVRQDVLIREMGNRPSLRYATSGKADFDSKKDIIVLSVYPQVYQDDDTVTGEIIIFHRDTDIVEVEHSNAFSTGTN